MTAALSSISRSETKRGLKSTSSPMGWWPMCSTPPAMARSQAPIAISPAAAVVAVSAPAHIRSTAKPGTVCGRPARRPTSRPRVRPWSPTWAVAAMTTSPIRSAGASGFRRRSSRTTLTPMSSARVFQKWPPGPALPNAVRTPSTYTTSCSSRAMWPEHSRSLTDRSIRLRRRRAAVRCPAWTGRQSARGRRASTTGGSRRPPSKGSATICGSRASPARHGRVGSPR